MYGYNNFDKLPKIKVQGKAYKGYFEIIKQLDLKNKKDITVVMDCYPGVNIREILDNISTQFNNIFICDDCAYLGNDLTKRMHKWLTDDRIFGVMTDETLEHFFDKCKVELMKKAIKNSTGKTLIIGTGAILFAKGDINIHSSLSRWEIQLRYRRNLPNWNCENNKEDVLTKFKRGYFVEWRLGDKHKIKYFDQFDYFIDTNIENTPKMISSEDYKAALNTIVNRPFSVVPYFDEGVWGGQWMKSVCGLDKNARNFAWCFNCVPEENSVLYNFNGIAVEMPSIDIVLIKGRDLLGEAVQKQFGDEFPIRFDFLDTIDGGNLSLQVHPTLQYIKDTFNINYTQEESYYILDTAKGSSVYLGLKEGVEKEDFIDSLNIAQETGKMDVEKYVNKFPAKKHDHFLIPPGTIHCSGADTMVLEISSTPYIFTFKLWDWGRLGLDGKPRPINISHGEKVIDYSRDTKWVKNNLINRITVLDKTDNYIEEKTGLHEFEFIETRRHIFTGEVLHKATGGVNVIMLVDGSEAEVVSTDGSFEPFIAHYAETIIVPASVGDYIIRPTKNSKNETLITIKAYVREDL